jgi:hypothetical protein
MQLRVRFALFSCPTFSCHPTSFRRDAFFSLRAGRAYKFTITAADFLGWQKNTYWVTM